MSAAAAVSAEVAHENRRQQRHERLYVVLQAVGWLGFLTLNLVLTRFFLPEDERKNAAAHMAGSVRVVMIGWLLTHYARRFMQRWGWKELGWTALLPRALAMALVLSVIWNAIGFFVHHVVLDEPWSDKYAPALIITMSTINGVIVMLGWLGCYFCYHTFARFDSSEIERLRLETSVKDAELRALKAQVNPHFMFNALNSVRALIDEDPARARQAVTQLANLLRYSLQAGALETVPFENELQVVNDYLALEQVRHEERLRLKIEVAPEVLKYQVPPMLLQTLVENAVKYGISPRPQGGEIGITARRVGWRLELLVTNPGLLEDLGSAHAAAGSTGLGLRNAANRLRLLYGEHARLTLRQAGPGLVCAEVIVPLEEEATQSATTEARPFSLAS